MVMVIGIDASRAFGEEKTGTETYSYQIISSLLALEEAKKHEWILYVRTSNFKFEILNLNSNPKFKNINLKIIEIPWKYLWTQAGLAYRTWMDQLDVLWVPAHTLPVLRKPGLKTVVTIHGIEYEWLPAYENLLQRWYLPLSTQYAVHNATKIIAVSNFTRDQILERMKGDANKIEVVYEGVGTQITNHKSQITNKSQILIKSKLKSKQYLLFVGTVQPRKNLVRLIEALQNVSGLLDTPSLSKEGEGGSSIIKLVIAGKLGWNYQEVLDAAKKNSSVIITGYIDDDDRQVLLENALVYIQPSITEGFGLPIIEAFQTGIPVVLSNGGALKEVAGDAGLLFDPYNIEDMAEKIRMIVENESLRKQLVKNGLKRAKDFSWERAARQTLSVITTCS